MKAVFGVLILAIACSPAADSQLQRELAESRKVNADLQKQLDEAQAKLIVAEKMLAKGGAMQAAVNAPADVPFIHEAPPVVAQAAEAPVNRGHVSFGSEPGSSSTPVSRAPESHLAEAEAASNFTNADSVAKAQCEAKWPSDFNMQKYCIDQQAQAVAKLKQGAAAGESGDTFATIRAGCAAKWPNDFNMREYCEQQQTSAAKALGH